MSSSSANPEKLTSASSTIEASPGSASDNESAAVSVPEAEFGKRLQEMREQKNLRHDTLSELTKLVDPQKRGIARTTLRGYELGIYKPGIRELRVLSQALGVTPGKLIFGDQDVEAPGASADGVSDRDPVIGGHVLRRDLIHQWIGFAVALFNLDNQSLDAVFKVATSLTEAKLGPVEHRRLMGASREVIDAMVDGWLDRPSTGGVAFDEYMTEQLQPVIAAILDKFGYKPPSTASPPPAAQSSESS